MQPECQLYLDCPKYQTICSFLTKCWWKNIQQQSFTISVSLSTNKMCNLLVGRAEWKCKFMRRKNALRHAKMLEQAPPLHPAWACRFLTDSGSHRILAHIAINLARNDIILYCRLKFPSTWADMKKCMNFEKMELARPRNVSALEHVLLHIYLFVQLLQCYGPSSLENGK